MCISKATLATAVSFLQGGEGEGKERAGGGVGGEGWFGQPHKAVTGLFLLICTSVHV